MSKSTRIILIISSILAGVGICLIILAFAMGVNKKEIEENIPEEMSALGELFDVGIGNEKYGVQVELNEDGIDVDFDADDLNITNDSMTDKNNANGADAAGVSPKKTFPNIHGISIEAGATAINVSYGDVEETSLYYGEKSKVYTEVDDGTLEIECGSKQDGVLQIVLPKSMQLRELNLEIGAGQATINGIDFVSMDAEVGAGELVVTVPDGENDYDYDINCAIGQIVIGNETYSGIVDTEKHNGAAKEFDIDCGAGRVEVSFAG